MSFPLTDPHPEEREARLEGWPGTRSRLALRDARPANARRAPQVRRTSLRRFRGEFLALVDRLFDGADHIEGGLREVIVFTFHEPLEALDGVGEVDELEIGRASG